MLREYHMRKQKTRTLSQYQRIALYDDPLNYPHFQMDDKLTGRWSMAVGYFDHWRTPPWSSVFWLRRGKPTCRIVGHVWIAWNNDGESRICLEYCKRFVSNIEGLSLLQCWRRHSYRTPLCVLYTPRLIAVACYVLAQRIFDGPNSPSLDARISTSSPSKSLPTPPSHNPPSPDASRALVDHYNLHEPEVDQVAGSSTHAV